MPHELVDIMVIYDVRPRSEPVQPRALVLIASIGSASALLLLLALSAAGADAPAHNYWVKLVCEASDRIATVRFGPDGAKLEKTTETRILQADVSGPHGIAFSPDRRNFYVSIGHGRPFGTAVKYASEDDRVLGQVGLGLFPATADVSPDGNFLYVVNFNLHGDPVPSSVSVVDTNAMLEITRIPTCVMPHGSRVTRDGSHQYSACMMDDLLVEIDAERMKVSRTFRVSAGKEIGFEGMAPREASHNPDQPIASSQSPASSDPHAGMNMSMSSATCSPTWAQPSIDASRIYVACNKSNELVEVDAKTWHLVRRIPAGNGVYNLGVSPDGTLLVATNKRDASVSIFSTETAKELARIPTKRKVLHGVAISPDSRYAFITVEGVGSEPGTVEILDLKSREKVATVDTPSQAAGIDFWKMD
jgi:DNA-binding beta-propeller fold protein YncE